MRPSIVQPSKAIVATPVGAPPRTYRPAGRPRASVSITVRRTFYRRFGKRTIDVVLGSALFVALLPFMLATSLAVLVTNGRPVFYRAERLGRNGQPFRMLKFRTMVRDADEALPKLLSSDSALAEEYGLALKLKDDPRTTRLGAFLRRFSIDELPQLWHVITGEMSLVGPRPYAATRSEIALVAPHPEILEPAPALTGPWQVGGRNELTPAERIAKDCEYVAGVTFLGDLAYLLATVACVVRANGR